MGIGENGGVSVEIVSSARPERESAGTADANEDHGQQATAEPTDEAAQQYAIEAWAPGEKNAYQAIYSLLFPVARRIVHAILHHDDRQLAHTAVANALMSFTRVDSWEHLVNRVKQCARNMARREWRRRERFSPMSAQLQTAPNYRMAELEVLLKHLRPEERLVVRRWIEGRLEGAEEKNEWKRIKLKLRRLASAPTRNGRFTTARQKPGQ